VGVCCSEWGLSVHGTAGGHPMLADGRWAAAWDDVQDVALPCGARATWRPCRDAVVVFFVFGGS